MDPCLPLGVVRMTTPRLVLTIQPAVISQAEPRRSQRRAAGGRRVRLPRLRGSNVSSRDSSEVITRSTEDCHIEKHSPQPIGKYGIFFQSINHFCAATKPAAMSENYTFTIKKFFSSIQNRYIQKNIVLQIEFVCHLLPSGLPNAFS